LNFSVISGSAVQPARSKAVFCRRPHGLYAVSNSSHDVTETQDTTVVSKDRQKMSLASAITKIDIRTRPAADAAKLIPRICALETKSSTSVVLFLLATGHPCLSISQRKPL